MDYQDIRTEDDGHVRRIITSRPRVPQRPEPAAAGGA